MNPRKSESPLDRGNQLLLKYLRWPKFQLFPFTFNNLNNYFRQEWVIFVLFLATLCQFPPIN